MWESLLPAFVAGVKGALDQDASEDARHDAAMQAQRNYENQREFAQYGIRWKVADAQAAGVHPLFALGGNTASYSPNPIVTETGQDLSRAAQAGSSAGERQLHAAQLKLLEAQSEKEFAMSSYYASEAAKNAQGTAATIPLAHPGDVVAPAGHIVNTAAPAYSSRSDDTSQGAARNPLWQEEDVGGGNRIDIPRTSDAGEMLSEMGPLDVGTLLTIARNLKKHGMLLPFELARGERFNPGVGDAPGDRVARLVTQVAKALADATANIGTGRGVSDRFVFKGRNQFWTDPIEDNLRVNRGRYGRR